MTLVQAKTGETTRRLILLVAAAAATWSLAWNVAALQAQGPPVLGGFPSSLPVVPSRQPRPEDANWEPQQDKGAIPSFVETLKGNDAALGVVVGQGRILTIRQPVQGDKGTRTVAVGDPTILDFEILPNPQLIRLIGKRAGATDLSITTEGDQTYSFEVHVLYDLDLLRAQLTQLFPSAHLQLAQIREHLVIEGQARSPEQVQMILQAVQAYLDSVQTPQAMRGAQMVMPPQAAQPTYPAATTDPTMAQPSTPLGARPSAPAVVGGPQIINLIRVPGVQQVMLQVRIAELNRTGMREIGADILAVDPSTGTILGTSISGNSISALATLGLGGLTGVATSANAATTTGFGIFPSGDFEILLRALRRNTLLTILAEPNLVAMSGHRASFLAGGQFPIPVPQVSGGLTNTITVEFKDFGVQLDFVPTVLDDESIRLTVTPEVSSIDFALGTVLVQGGTPVPGLSTRRTTTTVELKQGQTLAIAGLLQVQIEGDTARIPGLGDLPYIGPLFSNTSHKRMEKELLVMVTPYLVQPLPPGVHPCGPGEEIMDPNDHEFYFMNRIEGRTGRPFRATTAWDDPQMRVLHLERACVRGPVGFSE